jgi:hypothetical protein
MHIATRTIRRWGGTAVTASLAIALAAPAAQADESWQRTPTPAVGTGYDLTDVAAIGSNEVIAVGNRVQEPPVVLRWSGQTWKADSKVPSAQSTLLAVAARGSANVWAVGSYYDGTAGHERPTALKWNGTSWQRFNGLVADAATDMSFLDVAVVSRTTTWAVGNERDSSYNSRPTAQRRTGTGWQRFALPFEGTDARVSSVSALSPNDIWAVGYERQGAYAPHAVAWHWNGTAWARTVIPGGTEFQLQNVAAVSSSEVWAVGLKPDNGQKPAVVRWNGSAWSVVDGPAAPTGASLAVLNAVQPDGAGGIWAAGMAYFPGSYESGFFAHYTGGSWSTSVNPGGMKGDIRALSRVPGTATQWAVGREADDTGSCGACQGLAGFHK